MKKQSVIPPMIDPTVIAPVNTLIQPHEVDVPSQVPVPVLIKPAFLGVPDQLWQALITAIATIIIAYLTTRNEARINEVKTKLDDTAVETEVKLSGLKAVTDTTRDCVNSRLGDQLRATAAATRRIADLTQEAGDIRAAETDAKIVLEHEVQQKESDIKAGQTKNAEK